MLAEPTRTSFRLRCWLASSAARSSRSSTPVTSACRLPAVAGLAADLAALRLVGIRL